MLSLSAALSIVPTVSAHDPQLTIPTYAYLSVSPNPTGVNQPVSIIMWLDKYPPTANGQYGDRWQNLTVNVTSPDGSTQTLGPFTSDPVGDAYTSFTPDQTGTYTFVFNFPAQDLVGANPPPEGFTFGNTLGGLEFIGDHYEDSQSEPVTLTVQQEQIEEWTPAPLPSGFWSRPINAQNRDWAAIASNWLGGSAEPNSWQRYGQAPNSAHVVWTLPMTFGGIVDGKYGDDPYYDGLSYEGFLSPPVIINGHFYYNTPTPPEYGFTSINLQTGEKEWFQNATGPQQLTAPFAKQSGPQLAFGQLLRYSSPNQHGVIPYLWTNFVGENGSSDWGMYDVFTGNYICTITGIPAPGAMFGASTMVTDSNGNILIYDTTSAPGYMAVWNSTACIQDTFPSNDSNVVANGYWMWRPPLGGTIDAASGYTLNVTLPAEISPQASVSGVDVDSQVMLFSTGLPTLGIWSPNPDNFTQAAISIKPDDVGTLLWTQTRPWPEGNLTLAVSAVGSGVYGMFYKETRQWVAYNITTGEQMWGPTESQDPWDVYLLSWAPSVIADGYLLSASYGGTLYAYDLESGDLKWTYFSGTGPDAELPYGHYPLSIAAVADGKVFVYDSEHSPTKPYWRGSALRAVDINNGSEIWKIDDWAGLAGFAGGAVIADGYLVTSNSYDNQIYCFGKGQTETQVSASPSVVNSGESVLIQGKIIDLSPAVKDNRAVVPDEYMSDWMQYLIEQQALPPMPTDAVGVPVTLTATKPDGTTVDIGTINADCEGNFKVVWQPPEDLAYGISAYFAGTNSYFSSYGTTNVAAVAAPETSPQTASVALSLDNTLQYALIGAVIVAIIIGLSNIIVMHRNKRQ
jgi:outer membrane protein assembly factor BamB